MKFAIVIKNSFFYTFASVLQPLASFFLLPIYTRYLSPSDYAVLALVTAFIGIVSALVTFQIHTGIPRFVVKFIQDEERAKTYFSSIFLLLFIILLIGCFSVNIFGEKIIKTIFSDKNEIKYYPLFQIATWTLLPNLLASGAMILLQTLEKGRKFLSVNIFQIIVNVCFGIYFVVVLKIGVLGILWAQLISAVCGFLYILWLLRSWLKIAPSHFYIKDIKDSLLYSLPIIPHIVSIYIFQQSDRLILQRYVSLSDIGIYSIAGTFAYILLVIVNSTTTAYSFRFLKLAQEDKRKAQEETRRFVELWWIGIMAIFMGYLLFSRYALTLMTRPSFYPALSFIPILASAYIFRGLYCFNANSIFFIEKTKVIPVITIVTAIVNVILNLIFIPHFGIYAAAWNSVISYFITFVLSYYFSQRYFPVIFPWKNMLKIVLLVALAYILVKILNKMVPSHAVFQFSFSVITFILFSAAACFLVFKKNIFNSFNMVKGFLKA